MGKAMGNFTELDAYLFGQGTHYDIYKKLGAHLSVDGKKKGVRKKVFPKPPTGVSELQIKYSFR